jgi:hypothetical protein
MKWKELLAKIFFGKCIKNDSVMNIPKIHNDTGGVSLLGASKALKF